MTPDRFSGQLEQYEEGWSPGNVDEKGNGRGKTTVRSVVTREDYKIKSRSYSEGVCSGGNRE